MIPDAFVEKLDELYKEQGVFAAEDFLLHQLVDIKIGSDTESFLNITVRNELAALYRETGRFAEAIEAFRNVLSDLCAIGCQNTNQHVTVLINLAGVYRLTGDFEQALALYTEAENILSETGGDVDISIYASLLNNQALCLRAAGLIAESLVLLEEAFAFIKANGFSDHEIAVTLTNIASIKIALGEEESAEAALNEALSLFASMSDDDVHLAAAMSALGTLRYRSGAYAESAIAFERARDLTERFLGHNHDYETACHNLSKVLTKIESG